MKNIDAVFFAIGYGVGTVIALFVILFALWVLWYILVRIYHEIISRCFCRIYHLRKSEGLIQRVTDAPKYEFKNIAECECPACVEHRRREKKGN